MPASKEEWRSLSRTEVTGYRTSTKILDWICGCEGDSPNPPTMVGAQLQCCKIHSGQLGRPSSFSTGNSERPGLVNCVEHPKKADWKNPDACYDLDSLVSSAAACFASHGAPHLGS